jgi:hypothetical protein
MYAVAIPSAGLGLWLLVTGRTFRDLPKWPLEGTTLRVAGAYEFLGSLFVIGIAMAGGKGLAFITYAVLTLAFVAVVLGVPKLKPRES